MPENIEILLGSVDWKTLSEKNINQISHETRCWYNDYIQLQRMRSSLGMDIGETFKCKFDEWIVDRIKMNLD